MQWTLDATPESAALARELVRHEVELFGSDFEHTAVLLTDELVANAVLHGKGPVQLALCVGEHLLRISVSDSESVGSIGVNRTPDGTQTSGRGLFLVDSLSTRWGMDHPHDAGKRVWFELETGVGAP